MKGSYDKHAKSGGEHTRVRVSLHFAGGRPYEDNAEVRLEQADWHVVLERSNDSVSVYEGEVVPGDYNLTVTDCPLVAPQRVVRIPSGGKSLSVYLGDEDWPSYRYGENIIPFEPHEDLLAVAFEFGHPDEKTAKRHAKRFVDMLPLEKYSTEEQPSFIAAGGAIWLFRLIDIDERERVTREIRRHLGHNIRVGMPVDLEPHQVKILDNRFIVKFQADISKEKQDGMLDEVNARVVRNLPQFNDANMIEFPRGRYRDHLDCVDDWIGDGFLTYGEPDLLAEMVNDQATGVWPDDLNYHTQENLRLQGVDQAWNLLAGIDHTHKLGSPDVYVASVDEGIQLIHDDIGDVLTDGIPQIVACYDFDDLRDCSAANYSPDSNHGIRVYGIIAAITHNTRKIAGIAPNTHQIVLERPELSSARYADMLYWAAGIDTDDTASSWPKNLSVPATIINCSHGANGLELSTPMDTTLRNIAANARGGLGVLVIYSAGNDGSCITGWRTWAAHPDTMAISNSDLPDGKEIERRHLDSNYGPEIDLCAQGHNAPSLDLNNGEQALGGTSAAAATVSAAAALVQSVDQNLSANEIRTILQDSAIVIDPNNNNSSGQWRDTDGNGVVDFSDWYGHGRLDVAEAVAEAIRRRIVVKKSKSGICHDQNSQYYSQTTNFQAFPSIKACTASGGKLPK